MEFWSDALVLKMIWHLGRMGEAAAICTLCNDEL